MLEKEQVKISKDKVTFKKIPEVRVPKELAGWLEKIERKEDINLNKPIKDDQTGQVLVTSTTAKKPKITILPLTEAELVKGLKEKVTEAVRWLSEQCLRLIKMKPKKVALKP